MTLFLDCEFNGFGGQLISMALVSDRIGPDKEYYAVFGVPDNVHPWVAENVLPNLNAAPEWRSTAVARLIKFLRVHKGETVIADWPEDFAHLLNLLVLPGGRWHALNLTMHLVAGLEIESLRPHNALSDARALMRAYAAQVS